jgi:hypothetical protein
MSMLVQCAPSLSIMSQTDLQYQQKIIDNIKESIRLNQEVLKNIQITSQESMIIKSFDSFYESNSNVLLFIPIVNSESKISIRLIDHFVTKYSKNNKTHYKIKENDVEQTFNVHSSYKQQLKAFQKKHFDPFSRGDRIPYFMADSCVITTIGQLNFFKWFISKKVFDYILANYNHIEEDMNKKNKPIDQIKDTKPQIKKYYKPPLPKFNSIQSTDAIPHLPIKNNLPSNNISRYLNQKTNKIIVSFNF